MGVPHLALDLGLGNQGGHRVHHDHVDRAAADQDLDDLERLLPRVWLADQQVVDLDADPRGVERVQGVLRVHERGYAPLLLRLGDHVQGDRRLAGRLRAVDLDHPAAGHAADAEREVERERAGRDDGDVSGGGDLTELHDRALAVAALDLLDRCAQCLVLFHGASW